MTLSIKARLQLFKTWKAVHPTTGLASYESAFKKPSHRTEFGRGAEGGWMPEKRGIYYFYSMPEEFRPQPAHKVAKLHHTGWYSDNNQDSLLVPHVFQLPSNRNGLNRQNGTGEAGRLHFFAGYHDNCSGVVTVDLLDGYDSATSAAYAADSMAERDAEEYRDYDAQQLAEMQIEDLKRELHENNQAALALRADRRQGLTIASPTTRVILRNARLGYMVERRRLHKIIRDRQNDYWTAVPRY